MSKVKWIGATGVIVPGKDVPEEDIQNVSKVYSQGVEPFLKIVTDEPLKKLGINQGDIVGIRVENQSSSGMMYTNQIIEPKKSLMLPMGDFPLEITKLREKPSGIISEVRTYLGEL